MATRTRTKRSMPPEAKAAYKEIEGGIRSIGKSIGEIRRGLGKAEREIEREARARIKELRAQAKSQMGTLKEKQRDASQTLRKLGTATGDSWEVVKRSADQMLHEARTTASAVLERFREALGR